MLSEFPGTSFSQTSWVVVTAWCVSLLVSPIIVQLCRSYSIRLIAVIGRTLSPMLSVSNVMCRWSQYEPLLPLRIIWTRGPPSIYQARYQ